MDPITLMLLTVTLNALVTGIVVYFFQKRMEHSFAQKLFTEQKRFTTIYEKRVQTLEALYQKHRLMADDLVQMVWDSYEKDKTFKIEPDRFEKSKALFNDFRLFYDINQLFLDPDVTKKILLIWGQTDCVYQAVEILFVKQGDAANLTPEQIAEANTRLKFAEEIDKLNPRKPNFENFIKQILTMAIENSHKMEYFYKGATIL